MKKIVVPIVLLAAAGAAVWWFGGPQAVLQRLTADASAGSDLLYGNVDIRQASLGFRVSGRLTEVAVDEGDVASDMDRP